MRTEPSCASRLPDDELAERIGPLDLYAVNSIREIPQLQADIALTAERRYSTEHEESNIGFERVSSAFQLGDDV